MDSTEIDNVYSGKPGYHTNRQESKIVRPPILTQSEYGSMIREFLLKSVTKIFKAHTILKLRFFYCFK